MLALCYRLGRGDTKAVPVRGGDQRESVWQKLVDQGTELLLVYSEGSKAYDRFRLAFEKQCRAVEASHRLQIEVAWQTDHLFTPISQQQYLMSLVNQWIGDEARSWML